MTDVNTQAKEYASDQIPTARDANGFAWFYRSDIYSAYINGANWQKAQAAPLALVHSQPEPTVPGYDVQVAADDAAERLSSANIVSSKQTARDGFYAGVAWSKAQAAARLERNDWKRSVPQMDVSFKAIMAMLEQINKTVTEMKPERSEAYKVDPDPFKSEAMSWSDKELFERLSKGLEAPTNPARGEFVAISSNEAVCLSGKWKGWKLTRNGDGMWKSETKLPPADPYENNPIVAAFAAPAPQTHLQVDVEAEIASVVQSVNEWDDRTSPDDYPDHLLITSEELSDILRNFAATIISEGSTLDDLGPNGPITGDQLRQILGLEPEEGLDPDDDGNIRTCAGEWVKDTKTGLWAFEEDEDD